MPLAPSAGALSMTIIGVEWANLHRQTFEPNFEQLDRNNQIRFLTGLIIPAQAYNKAQKLRAMLRDQVLAALEEVDVLVLPSGIGPAPPVESIPGVPSKEMALAGLNARISFTGPFNLANVPAISVPCGFTAVRAATGAADSRQAFRGGNAVPGGPRLRAVHRLAHPAAADLTASSQDTYAVR